MIDKKCIFIKDPIHKEINFYKEDQWILELTECKEFKRLNKIQQLGGSSYVFPSATHTRLTHSLGTYEVARKILEHLEIENFKKYDRKIFLSAALLHDIGHGPHSHAFEWYTNYSHETMTAKIILSNKTEINKVLINNNINPQDIVNIIQGKHKYQWMTNLISSQIDADRIDYLLRDSHYTGASYGIIDYNILFKWMYYKNNKIVYAKKAMHVIENILFARYYMYLQVYENHHSVCYEWLIKQVMTRVKELYKKNYKFENKYNLLNKFSSWLNDNEWEVEEFINLNDDIFNVFLNSLQFEKDFIIKDLMDSIINENKFVVVDYSEEIKEHIKIKSKELNLEMSYYYDSKYINNYIYDNKKPIYIYDENIDKILKLDSISNLINTMTKSTFKRKVLFTKMNLIK